MRTGEHYQMQDAPFLGGGEVHCSIDGGVGGLPAWTAVGTMFGQSRGWLDEGKCSTAFEIYLGGEERRLGSRMAELRHQPSEDQSKEGHQKKTIIIGYFSQKSPGGGIGSPQSFFLSSPRAKRAGPKGLRAESARAVTGRQCPHSGRGEDFLMSQLNFFYGYSCNSGTRSQKIVPKVGN